MNSTALKREIHQAIDETKDNEILEAVYTILKKSAQDTTRDTISLSDKDIKELDRRWNDYKKGKSRTYSIAEAKKAIHKKLKSVK